MLNMQDLRGECDHSEWSRGKADHCRVSLSLAIPAHIMIPGGSLRASKKNIHGAEGGLINCV